MDLLLLRPNAGDRRAVSKDDRPGTCSRFALFDARARPRRSRRTCGNDSSGGDRRSARRNSPTILTTTASALARAGQRVEARQLLHRALAMAKERYVCRFNVAAADVDLGDTEQAFESLEQAYLQRSG